MIQMMEAVGLSSHPSTADRVARLRKMAEAQQAAVLEPAAIT